MPRRHMNILERRVVGGLFGAAMLLGSTACGTEGSGGAVAKPTLAPDTQHSQSPELGPIWPGTNPSLIPFPGRLTLPKDTCEDPTKRWTVDNPQPVIVRPDPDNPSRSQLLVVTDARNSFPRQCDQLANIGAGTYKKPGYDAPKQTQPDGGTHLKDGTVVRVLGAYVGEFVCNQDGGSNIWVSAATKPGGVESMVPVINIGFSPTTEQLERVGITPVATPPYNTMTVGGC